MKRFFLLVLVLILSLSACGQADVKETSSKNESESEKSIETTGENNITNEIAPDNNSDYAELEDILQKIDSDEKSMIEIIDNQYRTLKETIGDSYDNYKNKYNLITDWYGLINTESSAFYEKMDAYYESYYRKTFELYTDNDRELNSALDDIYDVSTPETFDPKTPVKNDRNRRVPERRFSYRRECLTPG